MPTSEPTWVDADDYNGVLDHDFDEAWKNRTPKHVRILGRVYTLPPERPAKVMILIIRERKQRSEDGERNVVLLEEILQTIFGGAGYERMLDDGLGLGQLGDVVDYCLHAYDDEPTEQADEDEGDVEGEAPPPNGGASTTSKRSSSNTGRSSKRTSTASTG